MKYVLYGNKGYLGGKDEQEKAYRKRSVWAGGAKEAQVGGVGPLGGVMLKVNGNKRGCNGKR